MSRYREHFGIQVLGFRSVRFPVATSRSRNKKRKYERFAVILCMVARV
jgi:hypothetical protein